MIFFSWSKEDSKRYAMLTKQFLEEVFDSEQIIWFSDSNIESGRSFFEYISTGANACDSIMLFLTGENLYNPWIQFELGLFYGRKNSKIWPIFFDSELTSNTTVFEHIQTPGFNKKTMRSVVDDIYRLYENSITKSRQEIADSFNSQWDKYYSSIKQVKETIYDSDFSDIHSALFHLNDECHLPGKEGSVFRVSSGFETYELYKFILRHTRQRLWVFGRKNKKLFDRGNIEFFNQFGRNIENGFTLKCLFLDPSSKNKNLDNAQKKKNFKNSLRICIDDAVDILEEAGFEINEAARLYRVIRNDAVIISDNIVFFENVKYSEDLKPMHLTNTEFFVTSTESCIGKYYIEVFNETWENAYKIGEMDE